MKIITIFTFLFSWSVFNCSGKGSLIAEYSKQFNVDKHLICAIIKVESNFNPVAINKNDGPSDSLGLMQIKYSTARELGFRGTPKQLISPNYNLKYGIKYLAKAQEKFNNVSHVIQAYNGGLAVKIKDHTSYTRKVLRAKIWCKENIGGML